MYIKDIRAVKTELRNRYKQKRRQLTPERKAAMDAAIRRRLRMLRQYRQNDLLFLYLSKSIEVDTIEIWRGALRDGKRVAAPRCVPDTADMEFYVIRSMEDVAPGSFGVLEPVVERCEKITDFSQGLCVVPGLCFDAQGYRLGYGKGYYDRFLSRFGGEAVGLCYSNSTQWRLPHGRYDRPVDVLVTDKYIRSITKR